MKKITSFLFLIFTGFTAIGQIQLINQGNFYISPNTTVYLAGVDFLNDSGANYSNEGDFYFAGSLFTNNGNMAQNTTGTSTFTGTNDQQILGSSIAYFNSLVIDHSAGDGMVTQEENEVHTNSMNILDGGSDFDYRVQDSLPLYIANDLTVNGDLRLIGEAQLLQTHTGASLATGSKYLWKDQQGTTNQYMYNYWSAPVNRNGVWKVRYLKDGGTGDDLTQSSYGDIRFVQNYNATGDLPAQSHPVYLNEYWIYAFKNGLDGSYDAWYANHIMKDGDLFPAEGYTMKGPGVDKDLNPANGNNTTEYRSYTFAGVPNDGDYSVTIDAGNDYLIGNPYPSALDADQFINDNDGKFNGSLYFWEHVTANDHYLQSYEGGYAIYNSSGGVAAVSWKDENTTVGTKTPGQYIPVGQGFFIWAEEDNQGGTINFNNNQRFFQIEGTESVFLRPSAKTQKTDIRLGFEIPGNYHRQLLLAVRPNTTLGIDYGWDGRNFDYGNPGADMNWLIDNKKYVIQAIPEITEETKLPLKIEINASGIVGFTIDEVTNLPKYAEGIYLYDNILDTYQALSTDETFNLFLNEGEYNDRFYITFKAPGDTLKIDTFENLRVFMDNQSHQLVILNSGNANLRKLNLYTIAGQEILSKDIATDAGEVRIPIHVSTGIYLVDIIDNKGEKTTTKLIIE